MAKQVDPARLTEEVRQFLAHFKTLLMATVSADGIPEASYAPFVRTDDNCFYIYVSGLARHTRNLAATGAASVLFIADERDTDQPFARKRLTFDCRARAIARDSERWRQIMDIFAQTFGEVMQLIRPLTDFQLFCLRPQDAIYVRGFAQAYRASGARLDDFEHIRDATQGGRRA